MCGRSRSPDTRCRLGEDNTSAHVNGYAAPAGDGNSESHGHIDCYPAPDGYGNSKSHTNT